MIKKNAKTKFAILGLLTIKPLSGYGIRRIINSSLSHFWAESNGQLYPAISQMEKEHLIVSSKDKREGAKAPIVYSITPQGKDALQSWLLEATEKSCHRDENLLKVFFGTNIPKTLCVERLKEREDNLKEKLKEYAQIQENLTEDADSPHFVYWMITLDRGISSAKAELKWCRESIKILKKHSP